MAIDPDLVVRPVSPRAPRRALRRSAATAAVAAALLLTTPGSASGSPPATAAPGRPATASATETAQLMDTVGGPALASTGVVVATGVPAPPAVEAVSYLVADLGSGAVLAAKAAHTPQLPASTLKVLTALTLLPELDKEEVVVGSAEAAGVEGSKAGIDPGLEYSIDLVFKAMLLQSGNDAAVTLALAAGGVQQTVDAMNDTAAGLQALDTVVVNPSGLDAPGQVTSAYDLALITRAAMQREDFRAYLTTRTADMPNRDGGTYQIQNENRFLASYDGAIGVKNGYTTLARHTFVGAAERNGRTLVVTVMKTEERAEPVVATLMDWGFANAASAEPIGELVEPGAPLPAGTDDAAQAPGPDASGAPTGRPAAVDAAVLDADAAAPDGEGGGTSWLEAVGLSVLALAMVVVGLRARVLWHQRRTPVSR